MIRPAPKGPARRSHVEKQNVSPKPGTERFFSVHLTFKTFPSVGVSNTLEELPVIFSLCLVSPTKQRLPILALLFKTERPSTISSTDPHIRQCADEVSGPCEAAQSSHSVLVIWSFFPPPLHLLWYLNDLTGFLWKQEAVGCSF